MSTTLAIIVFIGALLLSVASSLVLAGDIDRVGARLRLSEGLLGLLTALGANAPEISTAVIAIMANNHDLGLGVMIGSNLYNLASLLGLSAVIAGRVHIGPQGLALNGGVAIAIAALAVAVVLSGISPALALILILLLLIPYTLLIALSPESVTAHFGCSMMGRFFQAAAHRTRREARKDQRARSATFTDALSILPALAAIVLASYGMVHTATTLGNRWKVPHAIIGMIVLATLTGLPNVLAAMRLALKGRGSAVISESLNSNSLNVLAGICLPAVLVGFGPISPIVRQACWWMLGLTILVVALTFFRGGLRRWEGAVIIGLYGIFVVTVIW